MKKVMLILLFLFHWQCDKSNPSSIENNGDDSTSVVDTLKINDTTKTDTSKITDTSKMTTDSLPFVGTWVVHQHNINYFGDEWDKEVIRYYQYGVLQKWFIQITKDSLISFHNDTGAVYSRKSFPYTLKKDNTLLFYNSVDLVKTKLPVYYDAFGDTIQYSFEQGFLKLEAEYNGDVDYLQEIIYLNNYTGTIPPESWLNY